MATIGLQVITKEWTQELRKKLEDIKPYVDAISVQVNGNKHGGRPAGFNIEFTKWSNDFAKARNELLSSAKYTDYWVWMDTDDEIVNIESIRDVVADMDRRGATVMAFPYHYQSNGHEVVATQWRERIFKTSAGGHWVGRVHETFHQDNPVYHHSDAMTWVHETDEAHQRESIKRNYEILKLELADNPDDARTNYYMGITSILRQEYPEAIKYLNKAASLYPDPDNKYSSYHKLAEVFNITGDYKLARLTELQAVSIIPSYPDAYLGLAQYAYEAGNYTEALEWLDVAKIKDAPKTALVMDPTLYTYRPYALRALCLFSLRRYKEAAAMADQVLRMAPHYELIASRIEMFHEAAVKEQAVEAAKFLIRYAGTESLDLIRSLPRDLREDTSIAGMKWRMLEDREWPEGSVVYWCGKSDEDWGPDTLDKGMGGSEEAVVNLAKRMPITVFNQRDDESIPNWHSWIWFNPRDTYDTLIVWRAPELGVGIKANKKLLDLHDVIEPERIYRHLHEYDGIMFKSQWHRSLYPEVPDEKAHVITNGIDRSHFA